MERWNRITINGQSYVYLYKDAWGTRYYSFDGGQTWENVQACSVPVAHRCRAPENPLTTARRGA